MTAQSRQFWATTARLPLDVSDVRRVNIDQAAALVGRCRRTLYFWMAAGALPYRKRTRSRWIRVGDLAVVQRYSEQGRKRTWAE